MEHIDAAAFEGQKLRRPGVHAVAFVADWCPFCRDFLPDFAALDTQGRFSLLQADLTDLGTPLWETFDIEVVPTVVGFRDGEGVVRVNGRLGEGLSARDLAPVRRALL